MASRTSPMARTSLREFDELPGSSDFTSVVSLHAHTHHSRESTSDVPYYMVQIPIIGRSFERELRACVERDGELLDFSKMWWHPPVSARTVFESEAAQIDKRFGLSSMVSITDHDDITAGLELQALYAHRRTPISFEWTVPFGRGFFHIGIHNLPPASAGAWFARLADITARPHHDAIVDAFEDLNAIDDVLLVFNHPQWDLAEVGRDEHARRLREFLDLHASRLHALELNGYRSWKENDSVRPLASATRLPLISGGDRHGAEPNALLNLTHARSFSEFAAEVRDGVSHVVVMPEYRRHLATRVLASVSDVLRHYQSFPHGRRRWTDRVSWIAGDSRRTLSCHWPDGGPLWIRSAIGAFNVITSPLVLRVIQVALEMADGDAVRKAFPVAQASPPPVGAIGVGDVN